MNRIYQGRVRSLKKHRAAVVLPPERKALVLPMCQQRQGNGLRPLLCLDSAFIHHARSLCRNPKL